jgi:hypothetical protein
MLTCPPFCQTLLPHNAPTKLRASEGIAIEPIQRPHHHIRNRGERITLRHRLWMVKKLVQHEQVQSVTVSQPESLYPNGEVVGVLFIEKTPDEEIIDQLM